jgi:hypothetical protein
MFKKYWKEITLAFLINLILSYLIQLVPAYELNTTTMALAILAILTPLIAAIPAGYLIGKKTKKLKPTLLYPAIGVTIAVIVSLLITSYSVMTMTDAQWQENIDEVESLDLDLGLFQNMTASEFKAFTINALFLGFIVAIMMNFAFGLIGGYMGRWVSKKV